MQEFGQKETETRQEFLLRIAIYYLENTAGIIGIENYVNLHYDGVDCDGYCLADDLRLEFNLD